MRGKLEEMRVAVVQMRDCPEQRIVSWHRFRGQAEVIDHDVDPQIGQLWQQGGKAWALEMEFEMHVSIPELAQQCPCGLVPQVRDRRPTHQVPADPPHANRCEPIKFFTSIATTQTPANRDRSNRESAAQSSELSVPRKLT
jgi:hypothetical protein